MILRLPSIKLRLFMRLTYNKIIFQRQIRKPSQHILVASFTQSSISHQDGYFKKLNPFGNEVKKGQSDQLNEKTDLDNSEHAVVDKLKPILDNDDEEDNDDDNVTRSIKITDPTEIKENIFLIVQKYVESEKEELMKLELKDTKLKFEILRDCTMTIGKRIPNIGLNRINTVKDAIDFFIQEEETDQRKGHYVAEWFIKHKDELPPNMLFVPYVKERGIKREDRSKRQKKSKLKTVN